MDFFRHIGAMKNIHRVSILGLTVLGFSLAVPAWAQNGKPTGGFLPTLQQNPASTELAAQDDLWILETSFKQLRMLPIMLTDPETGEKKLENVWYVVYKFQNKPINRPDDVADVTPENVEDVKRIPVIFAPEFELVTHDNDQATTYVDQSIPEAVKIIAKRERLPLEGVVQVTGPLPVDAKAKPRFGVALWTGVNPETDFFSVFGRGFSSAYKVNKDDNSILNRTVELKYARPGDEYEERETEFRALADPKWIYRPSPSSQASSTNTALR